MPSDLTSSNAPKLPLIFYDGECPLCHRAVRALLVMDRKKLFYFASLSGETAQKLQINPPELDTLILYENADNIFVEGRAILRILWLLGGKYKLIGWLSFLPSVFFDWGYRFVARNRHRFFKKGVPPEQSDHFLS